MRQANLSRLLLLLLLLQASYLRAAKVNHIGESETRSNQRRLWLGLDIEVYQL